MHDINDLEQRGIPAMFIASDQFIDAAEKQSASLGFPAAARVFTPHPIQDRTDDEMLTYADVAFDQILDTLTL